MATQPLSTERTPPLPGVFQRALAFALLPAACLLLCSCAEALSADGKLELHVSSEHASELRPISKQVYAEDELDGLFGDLRAKTNPFCKIVWRQSKHDAKVVADLLHPRARRAYTKSCAKCLPSIKAGCWNFFTMNDIEPDREFRLIRKLYPDRQYDCYSVGFLQPFIMHGVLNCAALTMVDIDWRMLDGHLQMIRQYRRGGHRDVDTSRRSVKELDVGWVAISYDMRPRNPVTMGFFCARHNQQRFCPDYFTKAQAHFPMEKVRLNLTALHNASYDTGPKDAVKVLYMSNALEAAYTTRKQFDVLLRRLQASMDEGGRSLIIHHVGGFRLFGLYEVTKQRGRVSLRTVCRDVYRMPDKSRYTTHMEEVTTSKRAPTCFRLMAKHRLERPGDRRIIPTPRRLGPQRKRKN